jgi:hypothetical protein
MTNTDLRRRWRLKADPPCTWCSIETVFAEHGEPRLHDTRTLDHRQPKAKGGCNAKINMRVSCSLCNGLRGTMSEIKFERVCEAVIRPHRHDLKAMAAAFVQAEEHAQAAKVLGNITTTSEERALLFAEIGGVNEISSPKGAKRERFVRRDRHRRAFGSIETEVIQARLHWLLTGVQGDLSALEVIDRDAERMAAEDVLMQRFAQARKKKGPPEGDPILEPVLAAQ